MDDIFKAILGLYDASLAPRRWTEALDKVASALGARGALLFGHDIAGDGYRTDASSSFFLQHAALLPIWMERFGHYEEHGRNVLFSRPPLTTVSDEEIWPGEELWDRDDMAFQRENVGTFRRMGVNLSAHDGLRAGLILHYDSSIGSIPGEHHERARMIAPHAAKAVEMHRFHFELLSRYRAVLSVLDRVRMGVAVLNRRGEIVIANEQARIWLDGGATIRIRDDNRIVIADDDADRALKHLISAAHDAAAHAAMFGDAVVAVRRGGDREPLVLEVAPLRDGQGEIERDFAGALLYVIDPEDAPDVQIATLGHVFQLSGAETEVAALLARGHTIGEIAELRGVSFHTAQSQTRSIYRKTGLHTRGEIVHKALTLKPPVF